MSISPAPSQKVAEKSMKERKFSSNPRPDAVDEQITENSPEIPEIPEISEIDKPPIIKCNEKKNSTSQIGAVGVEEVRKETQNPNETQNPIRHPTPSITYHRRTSKNKLPGKKVIKLGKGKTNQSDLVSGTESPVALPNFNDTTHLKYKTNTGIIGSNPSDNVNVPLTDGVQRYNTKYELTRNMPLNTNTNIPSASNVNKTPNLTGTPTKNPLQPYPPPTTNSGGALKSFPPRVSNRKTGGIYIYIYIYMYRTHQSLCSQHECGNS